MDNAAPNPGNDRFAKSLGIELLDVSPEIATGQMQVSEDLLNGFDTVHGGALFTLANAVFIAASNAGGVRAVEDNVSIAFRKAANCKTLFAQAERIASDGRLARYAVTVTNEQGQILATLEATATYPETEARPMAASQTDGDGEEAQRARQPRRRSVLPVQQYD